MRSTMVMVMEMMTAIMWLSVKGNLTTIVIIVLLLWFRLVVFVLRVIFFLVKCPTVSTTTTTAVGGIVGCFAANHIEWFAHSS